MRVVKKYIPGSTMWRCHRINVSLHGIWEGQFMSLRIQPASEISLAVSTHCTDLFDTQDAKSFAGCPDASVSRNVLYDEFPVGKVVP